jgi:hypothetical protein
VLGFCGLKFFFFFFFLTRQCFFFFFFFFFRFFFFMDGFRDEASFRNIGFNQSVHIPVSPYLSFLFFCRHFPVLILHFAVISVFIGQKLVRALEAEFGTPIRSSPMLQPRMPPPALHSPVSTPSPSLDDNYVALPLNRLNTASPVPSGGGGGGGGGGGIADEDHYVDLRLGPTMPLPPLPPLPTQKSPAPAPVPPVRPLSPRQPPVVDHYNVFPTSDRAKSSRETGSEAQTRQLQRRNTAASVSQPNMHVLSAPPIAGLPGVGMALPSAMRGAHSPRLPSVQQSPMRRASPLPPQAPSSPVPQPIAAAAVVPGTPQNTANANYSVIALPESDDGEADPRKRWYYHDVRRDEAEAMLRGRAAGTFVMRPSSQAQFALTFVTDRQDFGHALVYHLPQGWQLESLAEFHPTLDALLQKYTLLNWEESRRLVFNASDK